MGENRLWLFVMIQFSLLADGSQIQHGKLNPDQHIQDISACNHHWNTMTNIHTFEMSNSVELASTHDATHRNGHE